MRHMRAFAWILLLCHVCVGQAVKVRVINGNDGRPLPRQTVSVEFFSEKPPRVSSPLHFETDSDGEAQFSVPEFTSEIDVRLNLASKHWHCACWVMADTETVLRGGILQTPPTTAPNAPLPPPNMEPGQIVFIARPFTAFEKLLYPLLEQ
jgi:hypothetical protein